MVNHMSMDLDLIQDYLQRVSEHYTAMELVELLDIDVWEIIDSFEDKILSSKLIQEYVGFNINTEDVEEEE